MNPPSQKIGSNNNPLSIKEAGTFLRKINNSQNNKMKMHQAGHWLKQSLTKDYQMCKCLQEWKILHKNQKYNKEWQPYKVVNSFKTH